LLFVDNLRTALTMLVVVHHISVIYSGSTRFYYLEPSESAFFNTALIFFQLCDQAYFMGLFFFLSGYFTPASLDRRGTRKFIVDRLVKLGAPLAAYYFLLNPIAGIAFIQRRPPVWPEGTYKWTMGVGPLWFIVMLLVFDIGYALWRLSISRIKRGTARAWANGQAPAPELALESAPELVPFNARTIVIFVISLSIASYLMRIAIPFSKTVFWFPTLAYLPQYISFFTLGILANRGDWLRKLPERYEKRGFAAAVLSLILLLLAVVSPDWRSWDTAFFGGGTWKSGAYAMWDSVFSVGICLWLITFFRRRFNFQNAFSDFMQKNSFTVFVIHSPVISLIAAFALRDLKINALLKFGLAVVICLPFCYAIAWLIRKIWSIIAKSFRLH